MDFAAESLFISELNEEIRLAAAWLGIARFVGILYVHLIPCVEILNASSFFHVTYCNMRLVVWILVGVGQLRKAVVQVLEARVFGDVELDHVELFVFEDVYAVYLYAYMA